MQLSIVLLAVLVAFASGKPSRQTQQTSDTYGYGSSRTGTDRDRDRTSERLSSNHKAVSVRGQLFCGTVPATDVRVKLWAGETGLEPNNLLDTKRTDNQGRFELEGSNENKPNIATFTEPTLTIYHNCLYDNKEKLRRVLIKVPSSYVGNNRFSTKIYDIGKLNLEVEYPKETNEKIEKIDAVSVRRLLMKMFFF